MTADAALQSDDVTTFLATHPAATAYAMPGWLSVASRHGGVDSGYHVARVDGRLAGVLPISTRPLHPSLAKLPSWARPRRSESLGHNGYAGPLLAPELDDALAGEVLAALIQSTAAPDVLIRTLILPAWAGLGPMSQRLVREHRYRELHAYPIAVKSLEGLTPSSLAATYHQSHRRAVDMARRRGIEVSEAEDVADYIEFYDLLTETMAHAGTRPGFSKDFVVEGGARLVSLGLGRLFLARLEGAPVAGVFMLEAADTACYWLGASAKDEKALKHRPMNAIFHRAFTATIEAGRRWFELGGLITEGLRTFKTRWGVLEFEQPTLEWSYGDLLEPLRAARTWQRAVLERASTRASTAT
jgi:hypothetical protein